jgi:hypothetical protein
VKLFPLPLLPVLAILCATNAAKAEPSAVAASTPTPAASSQADTVLQVANGVTTYKSPFDAATSVKLSAIVAKAKYSIDTFDKHIPGIRKAVDLSAAAPRQVALRRQALAAILEVKKMHRPVQTATVEMASAKSELIASGRYYNPNVLSGMIGFIADVDTEEQGEIAALSAKLKTK